jgi:hypothetical protein
MQAALVGARAQLVAAGGAPLPETAAAAVVDAARDILGPHLDARVSVRHGAQVHVCPRALICRRTGGRR